MNYGAPGLTKQDVQEAIALMGFEEKLATGALDGTYWTETTNANGAISISDSNIYMTTGALANGIAAIETKALFGMISNLIDEDAQFNKFVVEWSAHFNSAGIANTNNTKFIMGMSRTTGSDRSTDDVVGFVLSSDLPVALVDRGSVELTSSLTDPSQELWHVYKLEFLPDRVVNFYIDGVLEGTITAAADMTANRLLFHLENDAAAEAKFYITRIRAWFE